MNYPTKHGFLTSPGEELSKDDLSTKKPPPKKTQMSKSDPNRKDLNFPELSTQKTILEIQIREIHGRGIELERDLGSRVCRSRFGGKKRGFLGGFRWRGERRDLDGIFGKD